MYKAHCGVYKAENVAANTDITDLIKPENANGFTVIAFIINCSEPATIEISNIDAVQCEPDAAGYSARVNMGGAPFYIDVDRIKLLDACNINGMTFYYTTKQGPNNADS